MAKQFAAWFAAALVGGLLLATIGSYLRFDGPPPNLVHALLGSSSPLAESSAQKLLRASAPPPPSNVYVLKRGDLVPASLNLPRLDGKPFRMAHYRGQRVLLNFWATWCHPCRQEMPMLAAAEHHHHDQVQVIGIAMDHPAAVRAYLKKTHVDYPIVLGLGAKPDLTIRFDDTRGALPYSVLVGPDGRIKATHLGKLDAHLLHQWIHARLPNRWSQAQHPHHWLQMR